MSCGFRLLTNNISSLAITGTATVPELPLDNLKNHYATLVARWTGITQIVIELTGGLCYSSLMLYGAKLPPNAKANLKLYDSSNAELFNSDFEVALPKNLCEIDIFNEPLCGTKGDAQPNLLIDLPRGFSQAKSVITITGISATDTTDIRSIFVGDWVDFRTGDAVDGTESFHNSGKSVIAASGKMLTARKKLNGRTINISKNIMDDVDLRNLYKLYKSHDEEAILIDAYPWRVGEIRQAGIMITKLPELTTTSGYRHKTALKFEEY